MTRLTPAQSRLAALLLLVVALAAAVAAVVVPACMLHRHYDKALEDGRDQLARYRRLQAQRPAIDAALAEVHARDVTRQYLKAGTQTLAAAELQTLVTQLIEANGGRTQSSQVQPADKDSKASEPIKATITAQVAASPAALLAILHTLEGHMPYLFVDQLTVRATQIRRARTAPAGAPAAADVDVRLTISAYARHTPEAKP